MHTWSELTHLVGFDYASDHHDIIVVEKQTGAIVCDFPFDESAEGWQDFHQRLRPFPAVGVVIETSVGAVVERLLDANYTVFPINPKAACRYRERKAPSGVKTDRLDAWANADALRLEGGQWKPLSPEDPMIVELRQLTRDEVALIAQRTSLVNQLRQALHEYYPTALRAFDNWICPSSWSFIEWFPTSQNLAAAGPKKWKKFFHTVKLNDARKAEERIALFQHATDFCGSAPTTSAKSLLALTIVKLLRTLEAQLKTYRRRIQDLFEKHPDHDLFGSLPGPGGKIAARLLAETGSDRQRFDSAQSFQCYGGSAPVTYQSGKSRRVRMRRGCNKHLRTALHWLADLTREKCPWAEAYYQAKREQGMHHAAALRALGNRWAKILWKMWQTRTRYDADLHQRNQIAHGSWLLVPPKPAVTQSAVT